MSNAADTLDIYFVDAGKAFGANATILVSPSGESAMLDAGLPNQAPNVLAVFKQAGVKQLDYLVNTHFHTDHFGGTAQLAEGIPIINFIDHGETVEYGKSDAWWKERRPGAQPGVGKKYDASYETYLAAVKKGRRSAVKAGDVIPIKGIEMKVVCSGGKVIAEPLAGAGEPNPYCAEAERRGDDDAEDAQSIGVLVTYGAFKFIYLGDLSWNVELDLFCPRNRVGTVDAYLITHHAQSFDDSQGRVLVRALGGPEGRGARTPPAGRDPQPGEQWTPAWRFESDGDRPLLTRVRRPLADRPGPRGGREGPQCQGAVHRQPDGRTETGAPVTSSFRPAPTARSP